MDAFVAAFGGHLRSLRLARGMSQEEVAHRAGLHVTYLSGIERGRRNPSLKNLRRLAVALGVEVGGRFLPLVAHRQLASPAIYISLAPKFWPTGRGPPQNAFSNS